MLTPADLMKIVQDRETKMANEKRDRERDRSTRAGGSGSRPGSVSNGIVRNRVHDVGKI